MEKERIERERQENMPGKLGIGFICTHHHDHHHGESKTGQQIRSKFDQVIFCTHPKGNRRGAVIFLFSIFRILLLFVVNTCLRVLWPEMFPLPF
jgi:hypothetical protein